jgi:hypothetical protein
MSEAISFFQVSPLKVCMHFFWIHTKKNQPFTYCCNASRADFLHSTVTSSIYIILFHIYIYIYIYIYGFNPVNCYATQTLNASPFFTPHYATAHGSAAPSMYVSLTEWNSCLCVHKLLKQTDLKDSHNQLSVRITLMLNVTKHNVQGHH